MYYLRNDKIGLMPFCIVGPDITLHFSVVAGTGSAVRYCIRGQLGHHSMELLQVTAVPNGPLYTRVNKNPSA